MRDPLSARRSRAGGRNVRNGEMPPDEFKRHTAAEVTQSRRGPQHAGDQGVRHSSDPAAAARGGDEMTAEPSREEIAARLEAAEARTETRFAQLSGTLDVRFANLDHKIDQLAESVGQIAREVAAGRSEIRTARLAIVVAVVASVLAGLAVVFVTQSNMLAAFQASLAIKTLPSQPPKP